MEFWVDWLFWIMQLVCKWCPLYSNMRLSCLQSPLLEYTGSLYVSPCRLLVVFRRSLFTSWVCFSSRISLDHKIQTKPFFWMYYIFLASNVEHIQEFWDIFPNVVVASMTYETYPQQKAHCVDCLVLNMDEFMGTIVSEVILLHPIVYFWKANFIWGMDEGVFSVT